MSGGDVQGAGARKLGGVLPTADTVNTGSTGKIADAGKAAEIRSHYAEVAQDACECCEPDPTASGEAFSLYSQEVLAGLPSGALAASRGCGDPVAQAGLKAGERVLDLGSGGGIDALIAARLVGREGHVFGLDMTPEMVALARRNASEAGICNVEFLEGDIAHTPLPDASIDVVLSNCVINLCEDKPAVFREARRVLASGGRLVVSDIVAFRPIPEGAGDALATITGCRRGITGADEYRKMLLGCGFADVAIQPKTVYTLEVLEEKATRKGHGTALAVVKSFPVDGVTGSAIVFGRVGR